MCGDVDARIESGAADLVVVAQAEVGLGQQLAELAGVAAMQRGGRIEYPLVFGDHVAGAPQPVLSHYPGARTARLTMPNIPAGRFGSSPPCSRLSS